ncbi:MAG: hypothetical protein OER56_10720 [Hyphomicrobiales bacterium]|nr:hypothetical protein [Hyphomicrobiales bacterium]
MSYDLEAYFKKCPRTVPASITGPDWQIVVTGPLEIDQEDLYPEIEAVARNCAWLVELNLEGNQSREAFAALGGLSQQLIQADKAVLVDRQKGVAETQRGRKLLKSPASEGSAQPGVSVSLFFDDGIGFETKRFEAFYDLVEKHIPEALPRRYGPYEPMQFKLEQEGREHFITSWRDDPELLWRGSAPYGYVYLAIRNDRREFPDGSPAQERYGESYRCSRIEFEASTKLLGNQKACDGLSVFLQQAALLVGAFYAEIRRGECPVRAWWWHGLPKGPTLVSLIGPPYSDLWPDFRHAATKIGRAHFVHDALTGPGHPPEPPASLCEPDMEDDNRTGVVGYAQDFPFDKPA